nr:SH3 domain-containing protein [Aminobacter aminovorans]
MIHQLFNGDTVEITDRRGSWYFVGGDGFEGWAHRKWMSNSCGY